MAKQQTLVSVPRVTLQALKKLLFNQDGEGVNLTPIVQDLVTGDTDEDLMALNVGLVFKGLVPEVDTTSRFGWEYYTLKRYDFVHFSLIQNLITVKVWDFDFDGSNNTVAQEPREGGIKTFTCEEWFAKPVTADEPMQTLIDRYGKKPEPTTV